MGIRNIFDDDHHDRRNSDGRSWFEGTLDDAIKQGWQLSEHGDILCPHCVENGVARLLIDDRWDANEIKLNIKTHQQAHENNLGK